MARIDSAYNYFLQTYGSDIGSRYYSHKKSELRSTYNSILKANKEAPLYKISETEDLGQFAIDIKENANSMTNSVSNLGSETDDISSLLDKKIATTSNELLVGATYIGDDSSESKSFEINVNSLAKPQINLGNYINPEAHSFEEGSYAFELNIKNTSYEFQFNVNSGETNGDLLNKLSRLINTSNVGLSASILTNAVGDNALSISSRSTGLAEGQENIFSISSENSYRELRALGIANVYQNAQNSSFTLNGTEHSSMSNTFTVNKAFELELKHTTETPVTVGLMTDTEALAEGVDLMLLSYNGMVDVGQKYSQTHENNALFNDVTSVGNNMSEALSEVGIEADQYGHLVLDKDKLSEKINSEDRDTTFETLNSLKNSIGKMAQKASINPMAYLDKKVVEYKNPENTLTSPYATSQYSGLLVNLGL